MAPPVNFLKDLYGFKSEKSYRNQPPLGIGYLASSLREKGFPVTIIDCAAHGWDARRSTAEILATHPRVIGITAITFEAPAAYELAGWIKKASNVFVVLGGAHVNSFYNQIPGQCADLDALAAGESEETIVELCQALANQEPLDSIKGIRYKKADGQFSSFVMREPVKELDTLPPPAYDLYAHHLYKPLPHRAKRLPSWCMITSRGCSYGKCSYCEMSKLVRRFYRAHSPGRVLEEMETLVSRFGVRDIYFQDDIFINDIDWVKEFCSRLKKSDLDIIWSCESRFQGVSRELLTTMKEAGCWRIYYGFESGNQQLLDKIKKGFTLEEARQAARTANEAGLELVGFFMLGLPGETPEDAEKTIAFAKTLNLDHAVFSLTLPHPNTELYDICKEGGTFITGDEYFYKKASFLPHAYDSPRQLEDKQSKAFRVFYLRPGYLWRCLRKIRSLEDLRYYLRGFSALFTYLG